MSDVIIIGGGPGGAALGCYLSKAGISNTIIEKENHPRQHVGESMVTSSTRVFEELGFLETMEREGFVHKYGATWHAPANRGKFSIEFAEFPQPGVNQPYTYHVDRSKMDMLLLKHAESLGSHVVQGVTVKRVLFDDNGFACGVRIGIEEGEMDLKAKVVVDASGRNTVLGRQLRLKKMDSIFNQYAVHAWFEDLDKGDDASRDHIHIYFLQTERGWVWQIPITDTVTSVGVVVDRQVFKEYHDDLESYFWSQLQTNENLKHTMRHARRINEFKSEGDYSYSMEQFVGDGWLLVGDAARFVDPIFSSGVSIALYSAKYASQRIIEAFKLNDFRCEVFQPYEANLRQGAGIWYEFIRVYYKLLPVFTRFIQSPKYRLQVLQLLQGEVFDREEVPVLDAMRNYIKVVETTEGHLFKGQLTAVPLDELPEPV
jgi:1H-pyrrole-2-carbonyl-[peptidyl-carrier protein] chlorinase